MLKNILICILVLCCLASSYGATPRITIKSKALHSPKGAEQSPPTIRLLTIPSRLFVIPSIGTNFFTFAATASNIAGTSEFSNIVRYTNTLRKAFATLSWDANSPDDCVTNYTIHQSINSTNFTKAYQASTNTQITVPIAPAKLVIISVSGITNWPSMPLTNPITSFFRSRSTLLSGSKYRVTPQTAYYPQGPWSTSLLWPIFTNSSKPNIRFSISLTNSW